MFTLKQDSSLSKQQLFLNVLDHINVAYEYNISVTPEQKQIQKSEPSKKINFLIVIVIS